MIQITNSLGFLWALCITIFAIPSIISVAHKKNILDVPKSRNVHELSTPRLGGLAIFSGFLSSFTIFGNFNLGVQYLIAGCIIIFFIGLKDDIVSVSAFKKFFVQILATGIVVFMGEIKITSFQGVLGIYDLDEGTSYGFTFLLVIGITNALNLIDGLDGLAGSLIIICMIMMGFSFMTFGSEGLLYYSTICFCLSGSIIGFLRYNFTQAQIFMGDTGSLVCGFIVSVVCIQFIEMRTIPNAPALATSMLFFPVFDTLRVFALRLIKGQSPFSPDKTHFHHLLLKIGMTQIKAVISMVTFTIFVILFCITFSNIGSTYLILIQIIFFVIIFIILEFKLKKVVITQTKIKQF